MSLRTLSVFCACFTAIIHAASYNCSQQQDTDYYQPGNPSAPCDSAADCCKMCFDRVGCNYWTLYGGQCYFKATNAGQQQSQGRISGHCIGKNHSSQYTLSKELNGTNFFDGSYWNFETGNDPTQGYVNYVDKGTAQSKGYVKASPGQPVYIGCDHTNVASGRGRDSVRLSSKPSYNGGLFLLYLQHMPTGCGTWPAWWTFGPNWPNSGEIDIIEQVDVATRDESTLHTNPGCDMTNAPKNYTGQTGATNCYSAVNTGCGVTSNNPNSFGAAFNSKGGGLYAMQWSSQGIATWMWNEGNIPSNAKSNNPDPSTWGLPYGRWYFGSWCPASHFQNHNVIFDLTFCGAWDGAVFSKDCPNDGNCNAFVQNNPSAFEQAYWNINFMKVFQ